MRAVNLLPKDVGKQRRITAQNAPALIGAGLAVVIALVLAAGFLSASSKTREAQIDYDQAQAELAATPKPPAAPTATATALAAEQSARLAALSSAIGGRVAWDRILREFSLVLPTDVWLSTMSLKAPTGGAASSLSMTGYTYSHNSVARLLARLQLIPEFADVKLTSSQRQGTATRTVQFTITAALPGSAPAAPAAAPAAPAASGTETSPITTTPTPTS
jgi:Tfp pilus assembly protein PilN